MNEFGDKIKYPVNYKFKINTDKINCYQLSADGN